MGEAEPVCSASAVRSIELISINVLECTYCARPGFSAHPPESLRPRRGIDGSGGGSINRHSRSGPATSIGIVRATTKKLADQDLAGGADRNRQYGTKWPGDRTADQNCQDHRQ